MKLRNKKTGEIVDTLCSDDMTKGISFGVDHHDGSPTMTYYNSLAELNEDWEDYEEPKGKWFISNNGQVHNDDGHERFREERGLIGNYFETKEEAEQAVEKLKAWKWLKDYCNFSFNGIVTNNRGKFVGIKVRFNNNSSTKNGVEQALTNLNLLFGGEE